MENAVTDPNQAKAAADNADVSTTDSSVENTGRSLHPVVAGFNKLPIVRQAAMLGGIALAIALTIAIFIWSKDPTYKPLINRM